MELPGIETELLPGKMHPELRFRYVSFQFSTSRYLRFRFRILTASRALASRREPPQSRRWINALTRLEAFLIAPAHHGLDGLSVDSDDRRMIVAPGCPIRNTQRLQKATHLHSNQTGP